MPLVEELRRDADRYELDSALVRPDVVLRPGADQMEDWWHAWNEEEAAGTTHALVQFLREELRITSQAGGHTCTAPRDCPTDIRDWGDRIDNQRPIWSADYHVLESHLHP